MAMSGGETTNSDDHGSPSVPGSVDAPSIERFAEATIPTGHGDFCAVVYRTSAGEEHVAFVRGDPSTGGEVLVRVHSECLTGDIFGSLRCDCGPQLDLALGQIAAAGRGVLVYLRGHEGRGIGLGHKIRAYGLQDQGRDTVEANLEQGLPVDGRDYAVGAMILLDLGVTSLRLMTNNPAKHDGLDGHGLTITDRVPLTTVPTEQNIAYLRTKQERLGHLLDIGVERAAP